MIAGGGGGGGGGGANSVARGGKTPIAPRDTALKINNGYRTVFRPKTIFANNVLIYFFNYFGISELEVPGT